MPGRDIFPFIFLHTFCVIKEFSEIYTRFVNNTFNLFYCILFSYTLDAIIYIYWQFGGFFSSHRRNNLEKPQCLSMYKQWVANDNVNVFLEWWQKDCSSMRALLFSFVLLSIISFYFPGNIFIFVISLRFNCCFYFSKIDTKKIEA